MSMRVPSLLALLSLLACTPTASAPLPARSAPPSACAARRWFRDADGDGYGSGAQATGGCTAPVGWVTQAGDCDDSSAAISPAAAEVCNALDDDCDGVADEDAADAAGWFVDADGDGYGQDHQTGCTVPADGVSLGGDCDDLDAAVSPHGVEVCGDGIDNDCDGDLTDCGWASEVDLGAALQITGAAAGDWLGGAVALGDLSGDGQDELLAGATGVLDESGALVGALYSFALPLAAPQQTPQDAAQVWSGTPEAVGLGDQLDAADLDGDGYDDLLVGVQGVWSDSGAVVGAGYVLYGPLSQGSPISHASADWALQGAEGDRGLGRQLRALRDLDGDGADDFVLGSPFTARDGVTYGGILHVYTHAEVGADAAAEAATATLIGEEDAADLGYTAASADVDGDGRAELLVGALGGAEGGAVHLFAAEDLHGTLTGADAAQTWTGGAGRHLLGYALDTGDLDGDGTDDILMATHHDGAGVAIAWGGADIAGTRFDKLPVIFSGERAENFGAQVRIGDLNGDGLQDVLIAEDTDGTAEGLYGFLGPLGESAVIVCEAADVRYLGPTTSDHAFEQLLLREGPGGGAADLIVGTPVTDAGRGVVYLLPGGP